MRPSNRPRFMASFLALLCASLVSGAPMHAQTTAAPAYLLPPKVIIDILDAAPLPNIIVSPARDHAVLLERHSMPTIRELARPMLRLAGARINPRNKAVHRSSGIVALSLVTIPGGTAIRVPLPPNTNAMPIGFSEEGQHFAYALVGDDRVMLWSMAIPGGQVRQVSEIPLNAAFGPPCDWGPDGDMLLCAFAVTDAASTVESTAVPAGPSVQENNGQATPAPTFQDLLKNDDDERLFERHFTRQLAWVSLVDGRRTLLGPQGLYDVQTVSPNGEYLLVRRLKRPFSRSVPAADFARELQVWKRDGASVRTIADLPPAENVPIGGVPTGARGALWNPSQAATLVWVEALDAGDTRKDAPERDRLLSLSAPFTGEPFELMRTTDRFASAAWTEAGIALVTEVNRAKSTTRTWVLDDNGAHPRKLWDRKIDDGYANPGAPMRVTGKEVIQQSGDWIFLNGDGASPDGDRPFLSRLNVRTLAVEPLFQSAPGTYESVVTLLTKDGGSFMTRFETKQQPPNYAVRQGPEARRALTSFPDPAPQLTAVTKQRLTYTRKDGVQLSGTLYLPPDHKPGDKHPVLLWAYPREFGDAATAGQVRGSLDRFTTVSGPSHLLLLTQGYAILDDPTMPIVGVADQANDTYVEQLVASAEAAVQKLVEMGVADRDRIGVGGHSYGAFMTANLLAHTDLFRAGIARSGAYNRTLTPFGFQAERRTFWEAPDVYAKLSPFWHADKIKEPILMMHGEADDNTGTYPIQSERFYAALKGHGATVRYVTLPLEAHGYAARESVLHTVTEMLNWMDKYVKVPHGSTTTPRIAGQP